MSTTLRIPLAVVVCLGLKQTKPMHRILWGILYTVFRGMWVIERKTLTYIKIYNSTVYIYIYYICTFREGRHGIPAWYNKTIIFQIAVKVAHTGASSTWFHVDLRREKQHIQDGMTNVDTGQPEIARGRRRRVRGNKVSGSSTYKCIIYMFPCWPKNQAIKLRTIYSCACLAQGHYIFVLYAWKRVDVSRWCIIKLWLKTQKWQPSAENVISDEPSAKFWKFLEGARNAGNRGVATWDSRWRKKKSNDQILSG